MAVIGDRWSRKPLFLVEIGGTWRHSDVICGRTMIPWTVKILTQCVKVLGETVMQVWWWYLHWFRRYRKKTRGGSEIASPPPSSGARVNSTWATYAFRFTEWYPGQVNRHSPWLISRVVDTYYRLLNVWWWNVIVPTTLFLYGQWLCL